MDTKAFHFAYKRLNPEQKKAVDAIEGPVMVIAGPGTGKTTILTLRIANILRKTDTAPEQILALTFTESGVYSMRKNLVKLIGARAYRARIATFHSFCNDIIKHYPESFDTIIGGTHIGPVEQIRVLEDSIEKLPLVYLKPAGNQFFFVVPILRKISELKREGITPAMLRKELVSRYKVKGKIKKREVLKERTKKKIDTEKEEKKSFEFLSVYEAYTMHLHKNKEYDYDDMIVEVLLVLSKNKDLLRELQEEYHYILADEHQDVNGAQNKVLELLAQFHAPYPNLFIVGDEKQAIFRFQGASLENFLYFKKRYPAALLVTLTTNYRSGQGILDAAGSLIKKTESITILPHTLLRSHIPKEKGRVRVIPFSKRTYEEAFIVSEVKKLITQKKVPPHEIAVLYRDNKDALPLARVFEKSDISFSVYSDENILEDIHLGKLVTLLFAVHFLGEDAYLTPALWIDFLKLYPLDIYVVSDAARTRRMNLLTLLHSHKELSKLPLREPQKLSLFAEKITEWKTRSHNTPFIVLLEEIVHESGYMNFILSREDAPYVLDKLALFYETVSESTARHKEFLLKHFVEELMIRETYGISIKRKDEAGLAESVSLMTAHRSKGLEFSYVFISGAEDKHWGGRRIIDPLALPIFGEITSEKDKTLDDERRLFYVALTRAKKEAIITYAEEDAEGAARLPSRFIEEIAEEFRAPPRARALERTLRHSELITPTQSPKTPARIPRLEKSYLQKRFHDQGFSVTALNNYLECPWKYFYVNLLRIPQTQKPHQMYGTAIHEGLFALFDAIKQGRKSTAKTAVSAFCISLEKFPLSKSLHARYKEKGTRALSGYYEKYHKIWNTNVLLEFHIAGVHLEDEVRLTGKLDKIEFMGEGNKVTVVDYKTGKHHSRNAIEGKTKNDSGNEKRQLLFYKILLDLFSEKRFDMISGVIDFIEPDERGKYHREEFSITRDEKKDLIALIHKTTKEITSFSFWNKTCGKKGCEFCRLHKLTGAQLLNS